MIRNATSLKQNLGKRMPDKINLGLFSVASYRVGQKQLDDLNLAPCRHLCRWRGETHIAR